MLSLGLSSGMIDRQDHPHGRWTHYVKSAKCQAPIFLRTSGSMYIQKIYPKYLFRVGSSWVIIPSTASINRKDDHVSWPSNSISSSGKFLVSGIQQASNKAQRAKKAKSRKEPKPKVSSKTWFGGFNFIKPWNWFSQWIHSHDKQNHELKGGKIMSNLLTSPFSDKPISQC